MVLHVQFMNTSIRQGRLLGENGLVFSSDEGFMDEFAYTCHFRIKEMMKNACLQSDNSLHVQMCLAIVIMCGEHPYMSDLCKHIYNTQSVGLVDKGYRVQRN
jgi:hypothetical protein